MNKAYDHIKKTGLSIFDYMIDGDMSDNAYRFVQANQAKLSAQLKVTVDDVQAATDKIYQERLQVAYQRDRVPVNAKCHYCGSPAVAYNFFDVPVCKDCNQ